MDSPPPVKPRRDHTVPFADQRPIFAVLAGRQPWPAFIARVLAADGVRIIQAESLPHLSEICRRPPRVAVYLGDDSTPLVNLLEFIRTAATDLPKCFLMVGTRSPDIRGIATEAGAQAVVGSLEEAHIHLRQLRRFLGHPRSARATREGHNNQ